MGESYFWKPFAQGVATPIVLIGGTNLLLKDFKVSNPYLYWGGLAASSAIVAGILADKIKVPILNAESDEDNCPVCKGDIYGDMSMIGEEIVPDICGDCDIYVMPQGSDFKVRCIECGYGDIYGSRTPCEECEPIAEKMQSINAIEYDAESFEAEEGDDCPSCANACKHDDSNKIKVESIYDYEIQSPSNMVIQVTCLDCGESGTFYADEVDWHGEEAKLKYSPQIAVNMMNPTYGDLRCSRCNDRFQMAVENHAETFEAESFGKRDSQNMRELRKILERELPILVQQINKIEKQLKVLENGTPIEYPIENIRDNLDNMTEVIGEIHLQKIDYLSHYEADSNNCFICSKPATRERGFTNQHQEDGEGTSPRITDERGSVWFCKEHDNLYDFGLFSTGNLLAWTHPNGTKYVQGRLLKDAYVQGRLLKEKNAETFNAKQIRREPQYQLAFDDWPLKIHVEHCPMNPFRRGGSTYTPKEIAQQSYTILYNHESLPQFEGNTFGELRKASSGLIVPCNCTINEMKVIKELDPATFTRKPDETQEHWAETFNSDSHTDSFMADMPVNAVKNNDGWYIPSVHRNDYKEIFKNWKPSKYPYEKKITQDSVNEACNSCGEEKVHYQFYLAQKNSRYPKIRFLDGATYCQYDTNTCGGNICGDCAENASCENCGAEICTYCENENKYDHADLVCVDCREFNESLEDD